MTEPMEKAPVTCLLGAEGVAETEGQPWVRPATEEEVAEFRESLLSAFLPRSQECRRLHAEELAQREDRIWRDVQIDSTGRPYFPVTVLSDAPQEAWEAASQHIRLLRLLP